MSGLIIACCRPGTRLPFSADDLRRCAARLSPDHITPHAPLLIEEPGLMVAVVNPMPDLPRAPGGVCLGGLIGSVSGWEATASPRPDGSYAVCRWDPGRLELVSDNLASRTMWYVFGSETFLASTSQRALVCLLGDLHFNAAAASWLASSGTLGPDNAWDVRLKRVPAAAVLTLDRRGWTTRCEAEGLDPHPAPLSDEIHLERWIAAVLAACEGLQISLDTWLLPLSGGLDSRTILAALVDVGRRPRCITWGLRRSLKDPKSDTVVARRLAQHYKVEHSFLATDPPGEPARAFFDRYLVAGEGRTDQIAGYIDGLAAWKTLFDRGVTGVIRGDEPAWGYAAVHSDTYVQRRASLRTVPDYPHDHLIRQLGLAPQTVPDWVPRRSGESLVLYRDRLYERHSFQVDLAPLNDVKCAYLEVVNPFISDRLMKVTRELSESLRTERRGFAAVASALGPSIPEAKHSALAGSGQMLSSSRSILDEILAELSSTDAERICERRGLDGVIAGLGQQGTAKARRRLRAGVRAIVPRRVRVRVNPEPALTLSTFTLALRLYMASRMAATLTADAAALQDRGGKHSHPTPSILR